MSDRSSATRFLAATRREIRIPQWRVLLCGEWSLSLSVWLLQSVFGVAILAVRLRELGIASEGYGITLVIGPLGSGLVLWLASRTILRNRSVGLAQPWLVLVVWVLANVFRGLAAAGFGVAQISPMAVAGHIAFSVLWTAIFTYLVASAQYFRDRSQEIAEVITATARYEEEKVDLLQRERQRLLEIVEEELLPSLVSLNSDVDKLAVTDDRRAWAAQADRVGGLLIERVRSVSRPTGLAGESTQLRHEGIAPPQRRLHNVWEDAKTAEASVASSLLLFLACGLLTLIPRVGLAGYPFLACVGVSAIPLLLIARGVVHRVPPGWLHAVVLISSYLLIGLLIGRISEWFPGSGQVASTSALVAAVALFATLTGVGASLVRQHQRRWDERYATQVTALERYEAMSSDLDREQLEIQRQMSHLLHGPVQGNLAALTLALRVHSALTEGEFLAGRAVVVARVKRLIEDALDTLRGILEEPGARALNFVDDLSTLTNAWRGLMKIEVFLSPQASRVLSGNSDLARTALGIVEEGVTNASRHGNARNTSVSVTLLSEQVVTIQLDNDGYPLPAKIKAGFGLKSIEASGGRWTLTQEQSGRTRLTATVSI